MRTYIAALSAIVLVGCSSVKGEWDATCSANFSGYSVSYGLTLDLDTKGKEIFGDCTLAQSGIVVPGTITGTSDGKAVEFTCNLSLSGYTLPLTFSGDLEGDALDGTCSVTASGSTVTGTGKLRRP